MASPLATSVFNSYLEPLLKKHEIGQLIIHEDLLSSWKAAETALESDASASDSDAVKAKITELHREQLHEYMSAAKRSIVEHAKKYPLPSGEVSDSNYSLRCIRSVSDSAPNWKLSRSAILSIVQKNVNDRLAHLQANSSKSTAATTAPRSPVRTTTATASSPPPTTKSVPKETAVKETPSKLESVKEEATEKDAPTTADPDTMDTTTTNKEEASDGEIEEGEEPEEVVEEEEGEAKEGDDKTVANGKTRRKGLLARKKAALSKTNAAPKKKPTAAKGKAAPKRQPARRATRSSLGNSNNKA